ncbi:hypothetical protein [Pantoea ananatis]|uniref:hypothetical protein n=1 Tax=Pantoea ananas TaxID=553 RepID=UPI001FF0BBC6|nr:hypothetical protein [Pantoea ananatis]
MTTSKVSDNRSSKIIEILRSLLLLAGFFGLLTVGVLYGLPMMLHAKSENKLQQIGSLAMVKNNCHGFFYHDDDVSVLVMTSGYVVTVSGCVNADPGTAVMEPITGTPGIIVMPAENANVENTTVIPGVVSEAVMQQAINKAQGK